MQIKLNNEIVSTDYENIYDFCNDSFPKDSVIIVNGFQINYNRKIKENDQIFIIEKGVMPDNFKLEAMMSARHTPKIHDKIKNAKVAIAGLGGLGSNIAVSLARIGVGTMLLVDFDTVEPSNLNRQSYFIKDLGHFKTEALKKQLLEINPFINININTVKITSENVKSIFSEYKIICEAFDNPESKAMLVNEILINKNDTKLICGSGMAGYESSNLIKTTKSMKNLYICGDFISEAKEGNGLMAPRVQICAGHQANMVLRIILENYDV
ncbi:MAG: sulfur carrier protein ThiS adenylyltransferase ThiF [Oscillospiraceae bacterium]